MFRLKFKLAEPLCELFSFETLRRRTVRARCDEFLELDF